MKSCSSAKNLSARKRQPPRVFHLTCATPGNPASRPELRFPISVAAEIDLSCFRRPAIPRQSPSRRTSAGFKGTPGSGCVAAQARPMRGPRAQRHAKCASAPAGSSPAPFFPASARSFFRGDRNPIHFAQGGTGGSLNADSAGELTRPLFSSGSRSPDFHQSSPRPRATDDRGLSGPTSELRHLRSALGWIFRLIRVLRPGEFLGRVARFGIVFTGR